MHCGLQNNERFCARFDIRRIADAPSAALVHSWVRRFRTTASAVNKKATGKPKTTRTPQNIDRVRRAVTQHPRRSVRKHAQQLQLQRINVHEMQLDLKFHPYKILLCHFLKAEDHVKRKTFAETMINMFWNEDGLEHIIFSDEAHLHLTGAVNKHNCRY